MFIALTIGILYFLPYFVQAGPLGHALVVGDISAVAACVVLAVSILSYFFGPKKFLFELAFFQYTLLIALVGYLIITTGGVNSSFIALWLIVAVFASVFRRFGQLAILLPTILYIGYDVISTGNLKIETLLVAALATILPLVASHIMFHAKSKKESSETDAYHELASELSEANSKSDVVIQAIADGVIALNSKGVIELINPAAQQLLGWNQKDALTLDYKSVLNLTDAANKPVDPSNDPISTSLSTGETQTSRDLSVTTKGSKKRNVSLVVSPIGQVGQGVIVVIHDITKELAEEREQAEFVSTASHEMRTPVASIEGYLGLALNPNTAQIDEKARDFITKAHESAQHLGRLFQDLLDVSKSEDGRLSNHPKVTDVVTFVETIVEGLRVKATSKGLRLFFKPSATTNDNSTARSLSPIFYAHIDNDHLREVVANLVENAIKYTPEGDVIIDVTGDDTRVTISVQDSGIGIPAEDIPHLFQKFYRVDNSETREIGGTGLGLYLSRRLAEIMSGRIWVTSEFKKGSTFYLEIPRLDRQEAMRMLEETTAEPPHIESLNPVRPSQPPAPVHQQEPQPQPAIEFESVSPPQVTPAVAAPTLASIEQDSANYASSLRNRAGSFSIPVRNRDDNPQA